MNITPTTITTVHNAPTTAITLTSTSTTTNVPKIPPPTTIHNATGLSIEVTSKATLPVLFLLPHTTHYPLSQTKINNTPTCFRYCLYLLDCRVDGAFDGSFRGCCRFVVIGQLAAMALPHIPIHLSLAIVINIIHIHNKEETLSAGRFIFKASVPVIDAIAVSVSRIYGQLH